MNCHANTSCDHHEICFVTETIDNNFNLAYILGCVAEQECSDIAPKNHFRRSLTRQCCSKNLCNKQYPGSITTTSPYPTTSAQPPTSTQMTTHHTNSHHDSCKHGHTFNGYCYISSVHNGNEKSQTTRHEADTICRHSGMTLTSIHSQTEEDFIHRIMTGHDFWIGLSNEHWDDGTLFDFHSHHSVSTRDCVVMDKHKSWRAVGCNQHHFFLCKKKLHQSA
ncbi:uncharacterized protein LOC133201584 [Saccostrea echinata]|uniref:uncharacterized protein LOC133201584 n=1 Tax=Saccostrea echinata TaxID=191078 RepID=UPI002A80D196|nr:uncharacterized protein LOC133201584 [Saccostrea echinata]